MRGGRCWAKEGLDVVSAHVIAAATMATTHGLALGRSFVRGQAGPSLESIKRNYDKEKLAGAAASLGCQCHQA